MGVVTVFVREDCPFCEVVKRIIECTRGRALAALDNDPQARAQAVRDLKDDKTLWGGESFEALATPEIAVNYVYCSGAEAVVCARLTQTLTVPHVFFNAEYVGDHSIFRDLEAKSGLGPCSLLFNKMCKLGMATSPKNFPPRADAAMVKVSNECCFSSQPTASQMERFGEFGFKSVVDLSSPISSTHDAHESKVLADQSIPYFNVPVNGSEEIGAFRAALDVVRRDAPKPVLVHDGLGSVAGLLTLVYAAQSASPERTFAAQDVLDWALDMGVLTNETVRAYVPLVSSLFS